MRNLQRLAAAALAIIIGTAAYAQQSAPPRSSRVAADIDQVLADAVARGDVPGVVAMATDRRGVVYQGAFGVADIASGRPMTVTT